LTALRFLRDDGRRGLREPSGGLSGDERLAAWLQTRTRALEIHYTGQRAPPRSFHAAQVADRPVMLLVVGDPRRVSVRELERYGEVVKLDESKIFAR
jgi:hypothetical protein